MRKILVDAALIDKTIMNDLYYVRDSMAENTYNEEEMRQLEEFDACYRFIENMFNLLNVQPIEVELTSDYTREIRANLNLPEPDSLEKQLRDEKEMIKNAIENAKTIQDLKGVLEIYQGKIE